MDSNKFYNDLTTYIKSNDIDSANAVIMNELGVLLVKDRENFIALLQSADIDVNDGMSDADLIQAFINNIHFNRKLIIGSAFLVSHSKKIVSFDGEEEVSDAGVKAMNKVMYSYFDTRSFPDSADNYFNAGGDPVTAIASGVGEIAKLGSKISEGRQKKKYGTSDMIAKKELAKQQMIDSVLEERREQAKAVNKLNEQSAKTKKVVIITGSIVLGIAAIGTIIYLIKRK